MPGMQLPLNIREKESSDIQGRKILFPPLLINPITHMCVQTRTHTQINQSLTAPNPINSRPTLRISAKANLLFGAPKQTFLYILLGGGKKNVRALARGQQCALGKLPGAHTSSQVHAWPHRGTARPTGAEHLFLDHSIPNPSF